MISKPKPKNKVSRSKKRQPIGNKAKQLTPTQYQSLKQQVTLRATVLSTGGFPSQYLWRYQVTSGSVAMPVSANASTGLPFGFNWPNYQTDRGWSILSQVYDNYCIVSSYIRILAFNKSTSVAYRLTTCPYRDNLLSSYPLTSDFYFIDSPMSMSDIIGVVGDGSNTIETANAATVQKVCGLSKPIDITNDTYCGSIGGSNSAGSFAKPLDDVNWSVSVSSLDGSTIPATTIYMTVQIMYDVIFYNPLQKV